MILQPEAINITATAVQNNWSEKMIIKFILLLFVTTHLSATTFYVDATGGSDSNTGTSTSSAWRTLDKVNQQLFSAGDVILFKRGEVWKGEQLKINNYSGNSSELITFGAYPETNADKPIISTIVNHSHEWILQSGNIWKAVNPPTYHPERLFVEGSEILRGNSISEIDGVNFLWLYDADENGDLFLYSETDPSTKQISYTNGNVALYIENANYIKFTNINLQGGWTSIFINSNTSFIYFNEMEIGKYASNGIDINSENTSTPNNVYIKDNTFDAFFTLDYSMSDIYNGNDNRGCSDAIFIQDAEDCEIENNYFKNWGHASINIDGNPYGGSEVKVSLIKVFDNYLTSPDICYGGRMAVDDAHDCEVYNNQIIHTSVQTQLNGFDNHFHHNIIDGTTNPAIISNENEISSGIDVESYSSTIVERNIYENNLIKNIEGVGIHINTDGYYNIKNNTFRNNVVYNCGTVPEVIGIGIEVDPNTAECQTLNNGFHNNLIYNENTVNTISFRNEILDVDGFNDLNGTDGYSIIDNISGNPLFVNELIDDYHLLLDSPCIDEGTATLSTQDFEGNSIPYNSTLPDIGIYEMSYIMLSVKIFLEGPYNSTTHQMDANLGSNIPKTSPYSEDPRTVQSIPSNIVDWVLIQLRSTASGQTVTSRSAFLNKDGRVVADDGTTGEIELNAPEGNYYVVVKHRNHLAVMSANTISLNSTTSTLYDFTTGSDKYYGNGGAKQLN